MKNLWNNFKQKLLNYLDKLEQAYKAEEEARKCSCKDHTHEE